MDTTALGDLTSASDNELLAEQRWLLTQSLALTDQCLALHTEAERFQAGPEANRERYMHLHTVYLQAHEQRMQMHATLMQIYEELHRRGRYLWLSRPS